MAWAEAQRQDTNAAYQGYLKRFPNGAHVREARQRLDDLAKQKESSDCGLIPTFPCIKGGKIGGALVTNLDSVQCATPRMIQSDDKQANWKDIWTTSEYSFAPGGGGPGGGKHDDLLKVGGFGDYYYSLIKFNAGSTNDSVHFAALLLFSKRSGGLPVPIFIDRITSNWGWKEGDRLWWKDRPQTVPYFGGQLPTPEVEKWYFIDITVLYQWWSSGQFPNFGLQLRPTEHMNQYDYFASSLAPDAALRPRILVCL